MVAEAAELRGLCLAALAACSLLTRTAAGTIAVTVLSSVALGILTTVDWPVNVDWVSLLPLDAALTPGGGPETHDMRNYDHQLMWVLQQVGG